MNFLHILAGISAISLLIVVIFDLTTSGQFIDLMIATLLIMIIADLNDLKKKFKKEKLNTNKNERR